MIFMDLCGLSFVFVIVFICDGDVDYEVNVCLVCWLVLVKGVKLLVIFGYVGEGIFLIEDECFVLICIYVEVVDGVVLIIVGIIGEGIKVVVEEVKKCKVVGVIGVLVYLNYGWLCFGYQKGVLQLCYKVIWEEFGL